MESMEVKCPICGFEFVHIETAELQRGKNSHDEWLYLPMNCENGHHWELRLMFHEGNTEMYLKIPEFHMDPAKMIGKESK